MEKIGKYYKLVRIAKNTDVLKSVSYMFKNIPKDYRKFLEKMQPTDEYMLIEMTVYSDNTEARTKLISFSGDESQLYKIILNKVCYDYTGISVMVHKNKKVYSIADYNELIKK